MTSATKFEIQKIMAAVETTSPAAVTSPAATPFVSPFAGSISIPISGASMRNLIVPPGGFYGFANQTPATQQMFARAGRIGGLRSAKRRKRKSAAKKKSVRAAGKRRRSSSRKRKALVKGSAAAKRRMAQLRRMRRRK